MADVFLSYSRQDLAAAERIARRLQAQGFSVWWDQSLIAGEAWNETLSQRLKSAKAIVVLWSAASWASRWVQAEAYDGYQRRILVAARLDEVAVGPPYNIVHTADLRAPDGETRLIEGVDRLLRGEAADPAPQPQPAPSLAAEPKTPWYRRREAVLAGAALAVLVLASGIWGRLHPKVTAPPASQSVQSTAATPAISAPAPAVTVSADSVAVLPFVDMSEKKDQGYFTDGLSEELIDLIAKVPQLHVTARTSSFYFKDRQATIADIAKALGVSHVLEGSVRKSGNTLRISAQLVRCDNGTSIWSQTYDRKLDDIFKIQDDIAGAVVKELKVSILGAEAPARAVPTHNTEAYTLYLQGLAHLRQYNGADNERAAGIFRQALKLDPNFAQAWVGVAWARTGAFGLYGTESDAEKYSQDVKNAAKRALALDPSLAEAHSVLAYTLWTIDRDQDGAAREYATAHALKPNDPTTLNSNALFDLGLGQFDEAQKFSQAAIAGDPLAIDGYRTYGTALHFAGKLDEAEAVYRKALNLNPAAEGIHARLGFVLLAHNQPDAALTEMKLETNPQRRRIAVATALDALGRSAEAEKEIGNTAELATTGWYYQLAQFYAHRGDKDRAFDWLNRGFEHHDAGVMNYVMVDPILAPLRADPRYEDLLRKLKVRA